MKQVECNKCGKVFEVEGEWGYCTFCENDNVEVKKENDITEKAYYHLCSFVAELIYQKQAMPFAIEIQKITEKVRCKDKSYVDLIREIEIMVKQKEMGNE